MQFVTITSQGQITIPARMRRELGLDKKKKVLIKRQNGGIIIEPVNDILDLSGILHYKAFKNKSVKEIMKIEKEAVRNRWAERWTKKER